MQISIDLTQPLLEHRMTVLILAPLIFFARTRQPWQSSPPEGINILRNTPPILSSAGERLGDLGCTRPPHYLVNAASPTIHIPPRSPARSSFATLNAPNILHASRHRSISQARSACSGIPRTRQRTRCSGEWITCARRPRGTGARQIAPEHPPRCHAYLFAQGLRTRG